MDPQDQTPFVSNQHGADQEYPSPSSSSRAPPSLAPITPTTTVSSATGSAFFASPSSAVAGSTRSTQTTPIGQTEVGIPRSTDRDFHFGGSESREQHYSASARIVLPSPSRSRLDSQYSARLQYTNGTHSSGSTENNMTRERDRLHIQSASSPSSSKYLTTLPQASPTASTSILLRRSSKRNRDQRSFSGTDAEYAYSDRFIPSRVTSNLNISLWGARDANQERGASSSVSDDGDTNAGATATADVETNQVEDTNESTGRHSDGTQSSLFNSLLRSELLVENDDPVPSNSHEGNTEGGGDGSPSRDHGNFLRFQSPRQSILQAFHSKAEDPTSVVRSFSLSPVSSVSSLRLSSSPQRRQRKVSKVPFKVLDAPSLQDDFYLNLVDWSSLNVLAVGLGSCVYLWSACTSKVTKLCDLAQAEETVTSVSWTQRGNHLAVGTSRGEVQLWDTAKCHLVRSMSGHTARVGALSWSATTLASGSRDRVIYLRDVRAQQPFTARLAAHKQEVCGLKWSFDEPAKLASGGNDNKLLVWDVKKHSQPIHRFAEHSAAVKAIAWSPHQHGLLASGGGTADRTIRFWNTLSGAHLNSIDTGSQVCNLAWSRNCNEIVSTHGYSMNQIILWRYPSMSKVATLTGHTYRVLYLALSPDGSTIVTGAGDETLRFWQVFPGPRSDDKSSGGGILFPSSPGVSVIR